MSAIDRIYAELMEGNRRLAAAGVAGEANWTGYAAHKLATAIVRVGRKKNWSDAVIVVRAIEWIESTITEAIAQKRLSAVVKLTRWQKSKVRRMFKRLHANTSPLVRRLLDWICKKDL